MMLCLWLIINEATIKTVKLLEKDPINKLIFYNFEACDPVAYLLYKLHSLITRTGNTKRLKM